MAQVDGQTLLMAMQAVQMQIRLLSEEVDQTSEDDDLTEQEDLLAGYMRAADALRVAYETEELVGSNLPPYELLISGS
ncbi:hypothetical protein ATSB10_03870 [Dyella thiooxydans]|uniref:Uncharacterized protein n=1 Tax=Dyella thiooxydans TaxID=445710 RepID=A0A160MX75_9GAMM|nr:hypothetical protein [Dyella thiooxydans]AND67841.1 hypothetical protein ATSB10_03870 [Dyella thiooxydans]